MKIKIICKRYYFFTIESIMLALLGL